MIFLVGLGLLVLAVLLVPEFIVSTMKLTVIALMCYIVTIQFLKKEMGYLIITLYIFAVLTSFAQFVMPHKDSIKENANKIKESSEWIQKGIYKTDEHGRTIR